MSNPIHNQYAPPLAQVADVYASEGAAELKFFSAKGRIGRLRYLAYVSGATILYSALVGGLTPLMESSPIAGLLAFPIIGVFLWFTVLSGIKRCHDGNYGGWWVLTHFIPLVGLAWLFIPGTREGNRFGPPPPPNTWGVRLLGCLLPAIALTGILAAIALPAYKGYTDKARAARQQQQQQP